MNKLVISTTLAGTILLAGCSSLPTLPVEVQTLASQTQAFAQALCQFEPTAATIGAIAASLFPGGGAIDMVANGVASAICAAVAGTPLPVTPVPAVITASARHGGAMHGVSINGVPVEGQFMHKARKAHKAKMINGIIINGTSTK